MIDLKKKYTKMAENSKWKKEFIENLLNASNKQLFETTIVAQNPDWWDGNFTKKGKWYAQTSLAFLIDKLTNDKWFSNGTHNYK